MSIVMPAYNAAKTIDKSIDTVFAQTYQNWELIIVDDCSCDDTLQVLEKYKNNSKIKIIANEVNSRAAISRNNALAIAQGQYVAFLDSDDLWTANDKLEKQIAFLTGKGVGFAFTSYGCVDENDNDMGRTIRVPATISAMQLLSNTIIGCSTVLIDRFKIGNFEFVLNNRREDMFTWYLILNKGFLAYGMDDVMVKYRVSASSSSGNKLKMAKEYYKGLRDVAELGFFTRVRCFVMYAFNALKKRM